MDPTSVKRYVARAQQGEPLEPGKAPGKNSKLSESGIKLLEADLHERPVASYDSRAELLYELLGIRVSQATICRTVKRMGYTRKKDQWVLGEAWSETNLEEPPGE